MKNIHRIDPGNSIRGRLKETAPSSMRLEQSQKEGGGGKQGKKYTWQVAGKGGSEIKRLGYRIRVPEDND